MFAGSKSERQYFSHLSLATSEAVSFPNKIQPPSLSLSLSLSLFLTILDVRRACHFRCNNTCYINRSAPEKYCNNEQESRFPKRFPSSAHSYSREFSISSIELLTFLTSLIREEKETVDTLVEGEDDPILSENMKRATRTGSKRGTETPHIVTKWVARRTIP